MLGLPLAALILWLMRASGAYWWLWAWLAWIAFQFLVLALYPTVIAPLFNKFSPLPEGPARSAIEALLARCGFANKGLFVMDGSRRSSHGNAFFTGFGRAKRIVFFDTLLARLAPDEIEAVLAHELGHFRLHHVLKRMAWSAALALFFLALLAMLASAPWFYEGLGVPASPERAGCRADPVLPRAARVHVHARAAVVALLAPPRVRGGRIRRAKRVGRRARPRAREAVRGQRVDVDAGSHLFGRLRFASAGGASHRATADDLTVVTKPRPTMTWHVASLHRAYLSPRRGARTESSPRRLRPATPRRGRRSSSATASAVTRPSSPSDPDRMYTRADHRVKTPAKLLAQVQACNTNLGKGYFPEEEEHIAAYLNLEFYKFAP